MPRIFMALKRGERTPILEILNRMPPIPESSQWCTFLRNHDELTLEMVTEEEREWMWRNYAPEPRMRLNLGIRRRLAPLLDNDRRKIELAYSLLFTLPGSPVIYYGDEIGIGDNIWLKDRDGVRTPMQWSEERNAGFSNADTLYAPAINDDVFGYARVNVAAQRDDPNSLWSAIKRMIAIRRTHRVFGRGDCRFLISENSTILAYTRQYGGESILVVNNLSHREQEVALGLQTFEHTRPLDLLKDQVLPLVARSPYRLRLDPHEFLWLKLQKAEP